MQPASGDAAPIAFEHNDKFGFVAADPQLLGTGMEVEVDVQASGRLGAALKAGRLATTCSAAALEAVDVLPSADGASCTVKSLHTVGCTAEETLALVTEVCLALIEATKHE